MDTREDVMHLMQWAEREGLRTIDIARQLGVMGSTVTKWLYGTNSPSHEMWRKIAEMTGYEVTPNDHILGIPMTDTQRAEAMARDGSIT